MSSSMSASVVNTYLDAQCTQFINTNDIYTSTLQYDLYNVNYGLLSHDAVVECASSATGCAWNISGYINVYNNSAGVSVGQYMGSYTGDNSSDCVLSQDDGWYYQVICNPPSDYTYPTYMLPPVNVTNATAPDSIPEYAQMYGTNYTSPDTVYAVLQPHTYSNCSNDIANGELVNGIYISYDYSPMPAGVCISDDDAGILTGSVMITCNTNGSWIVQGFSGGNCITNNLIGEYSSDSSSSCVDVTYSAGSSTQYFSVQCATLEQLIPIYNDTLGTSDTGNRSSTLAPFKSFTSSATYTKLATGTFTLALLWLSITLIV